MRTNLEINFLAYNKTNDFQLDTLIENPKELVDSLVEKFKEGSFGEGVQSVVLRDNTYIIDVDLEKEEIQVVCKL